MANFFSKLAKVFRFKNCDEMILGRGFSRHSKGKKQILLCGYYGESNYGDELMLKILLKKLLCPEVEVSVLFLPTKGYNLSQWKNVIPYYPPKTENDLIDAAKYFDEVVLGGGAHIDDRTHKSFKHIPYIIMELTKKSLDFKKNVKWIGVSSNNEIVNENYIRDLNQITRKINLFSVRDPYSISALERAGIDTRNISLCKDLVYEINPNEKRLCVTYISDGDISKHVKFTNEIVEFIKWTKEDWVVCFIPFFNKNHSDLNLYSEIANRVDFKGVNYFIATEYHNVDSMLLMLKGGDLFVNMRYHASLISMYYMKPTVSICFDLHPHYKNKITYLHEQFGNNNFISFSNYKDGQVRESLKRVYEGE